MYSHSKNWSQKIHKQIFSDDQSLKQLVQSPKKTYKNTISYPEITLYPITSVVPNM